MASFPVREAFLPTGLRLVTHNPVSGTVTPIRRKAQFVSAACSSDSGKSGVLEIHPDEKEGTGKKGPVSKKTEKILVVEETAELSTAVAMNAPQGVEIVSLKDPDMILQICKGKDISVLLVFIDEGFEGMDPHKLSEEIKKIRNVNILLVSKEESSSIPSLNSRISEEELEAMAKGTIKTTHMNIGDIRDVLTHLTGIGSEISTERLRPIDVSVSLLEQARELVNIGTIQAKVMESEKERLKLQFDSMSPQEREQMLSALYTDFSEFYNDFMKEHLDAIVTLLQRDAIPYLSYPIIDLSGGTGVVLKHALDLLELRTTLSVLEDCSSPMPKCLSPDQIGLLHKIFRRRGDVPLSNTSPKAFFNELSPGMMAKAKLCLAACDVEFSTKSAFDISGHDGVFNTVLLTQTLHILPKHDKARMLNVIKRILAPGGFAIIMEERNFRVSASPHMGAATMLVDSIATPVENAKHKIRFMLEEAGLTVLGNTGIEPIDEQKGHEMILFLAQKPY